MAKTIALNLTINGVKQSITNINQLEEAIKGAESELKGLEIGSEQFKKLSTEIKNAKNIAEDFSESIKGQDLEKRVGAFAKVGEGITASFAGAQAALSLFGNESEAVAEAAAKAQAVLTIALAARSAAEGVVAVRTVAANIATYASAAAATAATTATRTLYATLAANPYGAILAVVGLVVGALVALSSESKEVINVTKELNSVTSEEANKLKQQLTILTQYNNLKSLQKKTIEDLKKEYPGFNAFLDKENRLTQDGIKFLQARIKQYELEAQVKLIIQKIAENQIKILQLESEINLDNVTFWQSAVNAIKSGGNIVTQNVLNMKSAYENSRKAIADVSKENDVLRGSLNSLYTQLDETYSIIEPYNAALETQAANEAAAKQAMDDSKRARDAYNAGLLIGKTRVVDFSEQIKKLEESFKQYQDTINKLGKQEASVKIVEDLQKIKDARVQAAKDLKNVIDEISETLETFNAPPKPLPKDVYAATFGDLRDLFEKEFEGLGENYSQITSDFLVGTKGLNQAQQRAILDISEGYKNLTKFIKDTPGFESFINNLKDVNVEWDGLEKTVYSGGEAFNRIIGEIANAYGLFTIEVKDPKSGLQIINSDLDKVSKNAKKYLEDIRNGLFQPLAEEWVRTEILTKQKLLKGLDPVKDAQEVGVLTGSIQSLNNDLVKLGQGVKEGLQVTPINLINQKIGDTVQKFLDLSFAIIGVEQQVFKVNLQVAKLTEELAGNTAGLSAAIGATILKNIDVISTEVFNLRTKEEKANKDFIQKLEADEQGLSDFKNKLVKAGFDVENAVLEDLLAAYVAYKKKEVEVTKEAEDDKEKARQKTYSDILQGFELFSSTLSQISALQRERVQTDLDMTAAESKRLQALVIGDSEQAAQKRLEIEQEYQEKSKQIEKKGAIDGLKLSLVQTIANGAQAFVKSLAELGPIAGPIFAGINAALTAFQVAIIVDQIGLAQSMRRGGLLKAQSGMLLQGPSHEQGGIPLAQFGVVAEGNEAIINRQSSVNYRDLLSTINQSGGGRPLVVNNFDDSRIVEALAKQNQKPIRAYVLESEITNDQQISKRLDDLSKL